MIKQTNSMKVFPGRNPCVFIVAAVFSLFFAIFSPQPIMAQVPDNNDFDPVTLHLKWTHAFQFAGYYAALEQGFYSKEGLEVTINEASIEHHAIDTVLSGNAQYGVIASQILTQRLSGKPLVVLAVIFQHSPYIILSRKDSNIRVVSDLAGREVMVSPMSSAILQAMLIKEGIALDKVKIIPHTWSIEQIIDGTIDASMDYITDQPNILQMNGVDPAIIKPVDYGIDFYGDCLFTTESEIRKFPERTAAFRRASLKGWKYAMDHKDELIDYIMELPGVRERGITIEHLQYEAMQMEELIIPKLIEIGHINPGRWKHMADTFVELGMIETDYSLEGFIYEPEQVDSTTWEYLIFVGFAGIIVILTAAWILIHQLRKVIKSRTRELQKSKERMQLALTGADLGTWDSNIVTGDEIFNDRWAEMVGYTLEELESHIDTWKKLIHPDDKAAVQDAMNAHKDGRMESYECEYRMQHKSGEWIWVLSKGRIVEYAKDGTPVRICGTTLDITRRMRAILTLQKALQIEESLALCSQDLIENNKNAINNAIGRLLLTTDVGRVYIFKNFEDPEDGLCMRQKYEATAEGITPEIDNPLLQHLCYNKDGFIRWAEILSENKHLGGIVDTFPEEERHILDPQGIKSILILPIMVHGMWYGFLGFDELHRKHKWTKEEIRLLRVASVMIGNYIGRRRVEKARHIENEQLLSIFDSMDEAIYVADPETYELYYSNEAVNKNWGKHIGEKCYYVLQNRSEPCPFCTNHLICGENIGKTYIWEFKNEVNSRWYKCIDRAIKWSNGQTVRFEMAIDVTEQKEVESALSESEEQYRLLVDNTSDLIWKTEMDFTITYLSYSIKEILGYTAEKLIGKGLNTLMTPEDYNHVMTIDSRNPNPEKKSTGVLFEIEMIHRDGHLVPIEIKGHTIYNMQGEPIARQGTARDITKRIKLESQLRQAQKMEAIGQLTGGIAHDFNNLLQVINGYSEMALAELSDEHSAYNSLEHISTAGEKAAVLISRLLAFSRRQVLDMTNVDLNIVISNLMKMVQRVIGENITLSILPGHDLGIIRADLGQLEQILMNLCVNARDAMPDGGKIILETGNIDIDDDYCSKHPWAEPGSYVYLNVTDTGCGIDKETLANIFEPFFTTKKASQGTGLGLSMVYGLIKQHKGMIDADSEIDKGTTFRIYLPLVDDIADYLEPEIESQPVGGSEVILIAEDDADILDLAKQILKNSGYTVLDAKDGEEAIQIFEEHSDKINLLLLDVMMPKLGGRAVLLKIQETHPDIRVLFASGYSLDAIHTNFILDSDLDLLQKPFKPIELLKEVRRILDS